MSILNQISHFFFLLSPGIQQNGPGPNTLRTYILPPQRPPQQQPLVQPQEDRHNLFWSHSKHSLCKLQRFRQVPMSPEVVSFWQDALHTLRLY